MQVGTWQLAYSFRGVHVMRLVTVEAEEIPVFEKVRERIEEDWRQERRLKNAADRYSEIRARYQIINNGNKYK